MTRTGALGEDGRLGQGLPAEAIVLNDVEITAAAAKAAAEADPERGWMRYLRALALTALHRWLQQRNATMQVGPELEPEEPQRLLALNQRATQLLCCSPLQDNVSVPLAAWQNQQTAPQLLLVAQVDEDNGIVHFPGVLQANAVVAALQEDRDETVDDECEIPLERFEGGLERLLQWVTLLEPEALPRVGMKERASGSSTALLDTLQTWLQQLLEDDTALIPIPVTGTRSGRHSFVRLITPMVERDASGAYIAQAVCSTPTIWAEGALAEIQIWREDKLMWRHLATSTAPIEDPISWPLAPLQSEDRYKIRVRPYSGPAGNQAEFDLFISVSSKSQDSLFLTDSMFVKSRVIADALPTDLEVLAWPVRRELIARADGLKTTKHTK